MDAMSLLLPRREGDAALAVVNERLAAAGLSLSREDVLMLAEHRAESLARIERVEFGAPAVVAIAEAVASSPFLSQDGVTDVLAELQDVFYTLRDELPADVPDAEIVDALRGCFDGCEGDASAVAALPREEAMAFCGEYARQIAVGEGGEYRIVDDEGRVYTFNSADWDYDEQADGWEGERWSDDFGD